MKRLAAALCLLALTACGEEGKISEVARYPSPAGDYDAVVGQISAGQSTPYLVVITKPDAAVGKGERLLMLDKADAPVVQWDDGRHMTIRCSGARVWSFRNFYTTPTLKQENIAVALECGHQGWTP